MKTRLFIVALLLSSLIGFEVPHPVTIPDGAYGVFQIEDLDVPLYTSIGDDQATVDLEDCALIRRWGNGTLIADHAGSTHGEQEWRVNEWTVGTTAFIVTPTETKAYHLVAILWGQYGATTYQFDGSPIYPHRNDLMCVSCGRDNTVFIAILEYGGIIP